MPQGTEFQEPVVSITVTSKLCMIASSQNLRTTHTAFYVVKKYLVSEIKTIFLRHQTKYPGATSQIFFFKKPPTLTFLE